MNNHKIAIIILTYSRIENLKTSIKNFYKDSNQNIDLIIQLDKDSDSNTYKDLFVLKNKYNFKLIATGGVGHDLSYKIAFMSYKHCDFKWILNDSIILENSYIDIILNNLNLKFDCFFITNKQIYFNELPIWYATRTGWVIYKNKSIDRNFIKNNCFNNFPQLMFYNSRNLKFKTICLKLKVNKTTPSYWINNFWETWFEDFINALNKLGFSKNEIIEICVEHSRNNYFFSFISMLKWPSNFIYNFKENYKNYMSLNQVVAFKIFRFFSKKL